MLILRGDAEISSSLRVTISLFSGKSNGQRLVECTFYGQVLGGCLRVVILFIPNFDDLLTVHLSIFISVLNQLDAQNFVLQ